MDQFFRNRCAAILASACIDYVSGHTGTEFKIVLFMHYTYPSLYGSSPGEKSPSASKQCYGGKQ